MATSLLAPLKNSHVYADPPRAHDHARARDHDHDRDRDRDRDYVRDRDSCSYTYGFDYYSQIGCQIMPLSLVQP